MDFFNLAFWLLTLYVGNTAGAWDGEIEDYRKIIFFYEILQNVEQPLQYAEWQQRGDKLQLNKEFYKEYNEPMALFQQDYETGDLLERNVGVFGALMRQHNQQARGLFHFLYQPLDWAVFVQNACWARQHVNAHMFVYAFTMAAVQRQIDHAMLLPKIYEILPRYFLNRDFVTAANEFEAADSTGTTSVKEEQTSNVTTSGSNVFKIWQWWKLAQLDGNAWHRWHPVENDSSSVPEASTVNLMAWWRATDYSRDLKILNEHSRMSYFTEDVDWNAYWFHLNLLYTPFLNSEQTVWGGSSSRRGEFWAYCLQQLLARYNMERLSHGFAEIAAFDWHEELKDGYDPVLIEWNNLMFDTRDNHATLQTTVDNFDLFQESRHMLERIEDAIKYRYYFTNDERYIDLNQTMAIELVANLLQCNSDAIEEVYKSHWYMQTQMYLAGAADHKNYAARPNVLLNYETMLRDPLFYVFHAKIVADFQHFRAKLPAYTAAELRLPSVQIMSVNVSELMTRFALYDLDASNLRRNLHSNKSGAHALFARQMRLTHKPFHVNMTIASKRKSTLMLRVFLMPYTHDGGPPMSIMERRGRALELNKFQIHLHPGENHKLLSYEHYFEPVAAHGKHATDAFQAKSYLDAHDPSKRAGLVRHYDAVRYCGLNTRLLLPRGWVTGLPMQMFFILSDLAGDNENRHHWWKLCTPLQGERGFGFPFDRAIFDEDNFMASNMYWKHVKIFHEDDRSQ